MKVVVLYHPNSEHAGRVQDYVAQYQRQRPDVKIELQSLETEQGDDTARLYDVTSYPAFLIVRDDGQLVQMWQEAYLPPAGELDYYTVGR